MKKLYNNTLLQLILALCTFSFVACQEFDIDSQPEGPLNIQIDALEAYTALATSPSNIVFNISSNTPWTIESNQQWCKPTPTMSAASSLVSEIVVTLENNVGKQMRTAQLFIKAEGIEGTKVVTIEQASKEDLVVIRPTDIVPTEGGMVSFNIISNKPWEIITTTQFLENIDKTSGTGNENGEKENITITVPQNTGAIRSAEITVKTAFQEETFTITQDGIVIETKNEEDAVNTMSGEGGEKTIEINSSVEWKIEIPTEYKEWLSAEADGNLTHRGRCGLFRRDSGIGCGSRRFGRILTRRSFLIGRDRGHIKRGRTAAQRPVVERNQNSALIPFRIAQGRQLGSSLQLLSLPSTNFRSSGSQK